MAFDSRHADLLQRFADKFGLPTSSALIEPWTRQCMEQFRFSDPAQNWGCKSTRPGSPVSDSFAIDEGHRLIQYDCVISAGAPYASLNLHPEELDITGQHFIAVGAKDHLGGAPPLHTCKLGASLFWGLGGEKNGWSELDQQLAEYRDAAVDYVRTFVHLNSDDPNNPWKFIGASVNDRDLETIIRRYDDRCRRFKLKVGWVFTGGINGIETEALQTLLCNRISDALHDRLDNVYYAEMANEYVVNGLTTHILRLMARHTRGRLPGLARLSLSSPNTVHNGGNIPAEVEKMYSGCPEANAITPHWNRHNHFPPDLGPHAPSIVICNEPIGPMSSVKPEDDPRKIIDEGYRRAAEAGYDSYVLHSDSGVWSRFISPAPTPIHGNWPVVSTHNNGPAILAAVRDFRLTGSGGEEPMIPYDEGKSIEFGLACNDVYTESGAPFDPGMVAVHSSRAAWDYYVGGLAWEDSKKKHLNNFRAVYGLPPI
jgi:hypothetical protein